MRRTRDVAEQWVALVIVAAAVTALVLLGLSL